MIFLVLLILSSLLLVVSLTIKIQQQEQQKHKTLTQIRAIRKNLSTALELFTVVKTLPVLESAHSITQKQVHTFAEMGQQTLPNDKAFRSALRIASTNQRKNQDNLNQYLMDADIKELRKISKHLTQFNRFLCCKKNNIDPTLKKKAHQEVRLLNSLLETMTYRNHIAKFIQQSNYAVAKEYLIKVIAKLNTLDKSNKLINQLLSESNISLDKAKKCIKNEKQKIQQLAYAESQLQKQKQQRKSEAIKLLSTFACSS